MIERTSGKFSLPQPLDNKDGSEWLPVPRIARTIPFGYRVDPDDDSILLPIKEELDLLDKAKKLVTEHSYRDVARWLTKHSGRSISHTGLQKRIKHERKRKRKINAIRRFATVAEKALKAAEKIERERLGADSSSSSTGGSAA